jgi:hypothetical protein
MQVSVQISDEIGRRFEDAVPPAERGPFVEQLLKDALYPDPRDNEDDLGRELSEDERAWLDCPVEATDELPEFDENDLLPHLRNS